MRRFGISFFVSALFVVLAVAQEPPGMRRAPEVREAVAAQVMTLDLRQVGGLKAFAPWKPGDPVKVIEDLRENAKEPPPPPASPTAAQQQPTGAQVMTQDIRELPPGSTWKPGDIVKIVPDLRETNAEVRQVGTKNVTELAGTMVSTAKPIIGTSFDGIGATGFLPPDTVGDIGPNHYVQAVNSSLSIYSRGGTLLAGPVPINSLWSGFGGPCSSQNNGDPIVRYDHIADRWLVSQFALPSTGNYYQCFAISRSGDPVSGGWYLYGFRTLDNTTPVFPDYPKIGVWPDAYYMGTQRGYPSSGLDLWAFERGKMLVGALAKQVHFFVGGTSLFLMPSDLDGPPPPAGTPNFFLRQVDGDRFGGSDRLEMYACRVNWANPPASTLTALPSLATAPFDSVLCSNDLMEACATQPGTAVKLETLAVWTMWRAQYRNFGMYESLVFNHTVNAGANLAGVRWYELRRPPNGNWSIYQQGTYAPNNVNRWMGSTAMDGSGDIAQGFSVSNATVFPGISVALRRSSDPAGVLSAETSLVTGAGSQTYSPAPRWGNYSTMDVDPVNDCTFWYTTEYYSATSQAGWRTRVNSFTVPSCLGPQGTWVVANNAITNFGAWASAPGAQAIVGDFNGDGLSDVLLTGVAGWSTIPVAFSNGDGTFTVTNSGVPNFPQWASSPGVKILAGDFNGDGKTDLALTGVSGWTTLPVATSNGNGTFTVTNNAVGSFAGWAASAGAKALVGDFNGDGKADIALTGVSGWTTLPVAFSTGAGTFNVTNNPIANFAAWAAVAGAKPLVGDFNGDGKSDIALTGVAGWTTLPVAFSSGNGSFNVTNEGVLNFAGWASTANATPLVGDFNGDGKSDIALTGPAGWTSVPVAFSNADGTFQITNLPISNFAAWASSPNAKPLAGDFNGDGVTDLALTGTVGWTTLPVAFSNSDGSFTVTNKSVLDFGGWAASANVKFLVGDFDGSGKKDIALTGATGWTTLPVAFSISR